MKRELAVETKSLRSSGFEKVSQNVLMTLAGLASSPS